MKKIGILTLYGNINHGNKLQNFALLQTIKNISNYDVYTIYKKDKVNYIKLFIKNIIDFKNYYRRNKISSINNKLNYINYSKVNDNFFDYIVIGSDQVWNYTFYGFDYNYYFANKFNAKKISYAASVGLPKIDDNEKLKFKQYLDKFSDISVRELDAKKFLGDILNKEISNTLDPTLLLSRSDWESYIKPSKKLPKNKYIFYYFLGGKDETVYNSIVDYSKKNHLEIINILDKNSKYYCINMFDFINLIKESEFVFTNSFHACVFSFLFDKSFITYEENNIERASMSSRIETLTTMFDLKNRKFDGKTITKENLNHDYINGYNILNIEREKSISFLKKALDIK